MTYSEVVLESERAEVAFTINIQYSKQVLERLCRIWYIHSEQTHTHILKYTYLWFFSVFHCQHKVQICLIILQQCDILISTHNHNGYTTSPSYVRHSWNILSMNTFVSVPVPYLINGIAWLSYTQTQSVHNGLP